MATTKILIDGVGIDLTGDTATAADILSGKTAHSASGTVTGTIATKTASNMTVSGATVTAPSGYYASAQSKSVPSGSQGTPTATKSISGTTATVTPKCTDTTGYITGSTKTGSAVTVTATELDTLGKKTISGNGTVDVVGYSSVEVSVAAQGKNEHSTTWDFSDRAEYRMYIAQGTYTFESDSTYEYKLYLPTNDRVWINNCQNPSSTKNVVFNATSYDRLNTISDITATGFKYTGTSTITENCILIPYYMLSGQTLTWTFTRNNTNRGGYIWCDISGRFVSQERVVFSGSGTSTWTYTAPTDGWLYLKAGNYNAGGVVTFSNCSLTIT